MSSFDTPRSGLLFRPEQAAFAYPGLSGPESQPSPGRGCPFIVWHPFFWHGSSPRGSNSMSAVGQERRFLRGVQFRSDFVRNDDLVFSRSG